MCRKAQRRHAAKKPAMTIVRTFCMKVCWSMPQTVAGCLPQTPAPFASIPRGLPEAPLPRPEDIDAEKEVGGRVRDNACPERTRANGHDVVECPGDDGRPEIRSPM